jgi:hypothetical protein
MSDELETIARSWQNLLDADAGVPEERMTEPGVEGEWSVKDVLAHVAYWDNVDLEMIERFANGVAETEGEDYQAINERVYAERHGWPLADVRRDLLDTHERVLTALRNTPGFDLSRLRESWEHYDEHSAEIRAWRKRVGV